MTITITKAIILTMTIMAVSACFGCRTVHTISNIKDASRAPLYDSANGYPGVIAPSALAPLKVWETRILKSERSASSNIAPTVMIGPIMEAAHNFRTLQRQLRMDSTDLRERGRGYDDIEWFYLVHSVRPLVYTIIAHNGIIQHHATQSRTKYNSDVIEKLFAESQLVGIHLEYKSRSRTHKVQTSDGIRVGVHGEMLTGWGMVFASHLEVPLDILEYHVFYTENASDLESHRLVASQLAPFRVAGQQGVWTVAVPSDKPSVVVEFAQLNEHGLVIRARPHSIVESGR